MGEIADQLPSWAVVLLLLAVSVLGSFVLRSVFTRFDKLENRVDCVETTQQQHITRDEHDKEINLLTSRWHADFKELQGQIAESNKQVHSRLDDLHVVLINLFSSKHD